MKTQIKDPKILLKLFFSTFKLSAFTFGGGYVIVSLMQKKFVQDYKWLEEKEMLNLTAIAQSSPGAIAVNASIIIGYHIAGLYGALVTILGTVLPPFLIISVVSFFYTQFRDSSLICALLGGMQAGIAAVIIDVVYSMGKGIVKEGQAIQIIVMPAAFIATYFLKVNILITLLILSAMGILFACLKKYSKSRRKI